MLDGVENLWVAEFLRRSVVAYPVVNAMHIVSLGALVTSAVLMDVRVLGAGRRVPLEDAVAVLRPVAIGALIATVLTGTLLFTVQPKTYFTNPVFLVKMGFLSLAVVNAGIFVLTRRHLNPDMASTRAMAFVSIWLWLLTVMAGRSIAFFD